MEKNKILLILLLILSLVGIYYSSYLLNLFQLNKVEGGYPIILYDNIKNIHTFSIYSFKDKQIKAALDVEGKPIVITNSSSVYVSPNFKYTAYTDDQGLWLFSNLNLTTKQIFTSTLIESVYWSKDGSSIIFSVEDCNKNPCFGREKAANPGNYGHHLYKLAENSSSKIPQSDQIQSVVAFIDDHRVLIIPSNPTRIDQLAILNTRNMTLDLNQIQEAFGFEALQFSFTRDGKKWTFNLSRNPTNDSNIIYADFPKKEGVQIANSDWANLQFPKLSPKGTKIVYLRRINMQPNKTSDYDLWIYDTQKKTNKKVLNGSAAGPWIDEDTLIIRTNDMINTVHTAILHLNSGIVERID